MESAVACGQAGVVEFLLKRFNVRGPMDDSFINAATNRFVDVVRLLPSQSCAVDEALGLVAANGHLAVLEYLLFERRESYSSDGDDSHSAILRILTTPLAVQSQYGSTKVSTAAAMRAMCAAARNDHSDVMELLVRNGSQEQLGFALAASAAADSTKLVEMLVEKYEPAGGVCSHREIHSDRRGKCYSAPCSVERTLLDAVEANNIGMVKLLAKKAHVRVVNEAKSIAMANGFTDVAEVLAAAAP
ncbi:hypothetical protein PHYSODRAFT_295361 [Phytophthora sojae]|uniref:Ankyrin repeat-containing domain n=1 Tax=Phytophthora sojae (strain P6497) TaxID=1094619 RepID=G4YQY7_PHYSP|nr:hypothetical protein PHYSODRAFT_295361 [Phytophthora sojae]EGZ30615.1 hypothetical protein PHYSODRAFT_295361 [Phytophthora sojae]|eukprot:XP_009517890.1 hypothetical protein PHYSODRAFT_295361 [Phytophthora sojae]